MNSLVFAPGSDKGKWKAGGGTQKDGGPITLLKHTRQDPTIFYFCRKLDPVQTDGKLRRVGASIQEKK